MHMWPGPSAWSAWFFSAKGGARHTSWPTQLSRATRLPGGGGGGKPHRRGTPKTLVPGGAQNTRTKVVAWELNHPYSPFTPCLFHRTALSCGCLRLTARRWCLGSPCTRKARPAWRQAACRCARTAAASILLQVYPCYKHTAASVLYHSACCVACPGPAVLSASSTVCGSRPVSCVGLTTVSHGCRADQLSHGLLVQFHSAAWVLTPTSQGCSP